jgi:hypothetical protein
LILTEEQGAEFLSALPAILDAVAGEKANA